MIAVGYSKRVSNLIVKEVVPIKEQNDRIRDYAQSNGFKIIRFYEDKSNDPNSDGGFQELRIDGMNRRFDLVILDSIFRFGRNYAYAKNLLYMTFYKLGIHFAVLEDGINTMNMTAEEVEQYFQKLKCRHAKEFEYSQRQEKFLSERQIPECWERYGYLFNDNRTELLIDGEAAKVIRMIFERAAVGTKKVEIARELNRIGAETPSVHMHRVGMKKVKAGRTEWVAEAVGRILATEVYMGDDHTSLAEGAIYPQIIAPEIFHKAQEIIKPNHIKRYRNYYLLKRWIYFMDTDERLCYRERTIDGKRITYYHRSQDDICLIEFEEVLNALRSAFAKEKELAFRICKAGQESKRRFTHEIDDSYRERAEELFQFSLKAQNGNVELFGRYDKGEISKKEYDSAHDVIMKKQEKINGLFHELMEEKKKRIIYLGKDNPWVRRFLKYDSRNELSCNMVNALVRRVEVYPGRRIIVHLNTDGKEYIPEEMLKETRADGKKE